MNVWSWSYLRMIGVVWVRTVPEDWRERLIDGAEERVEL